MAQDHAALPSKGQLSCSKCFALRLSGCQVVARGAASDWLSGQAARCRMTATQTQRGVLGT